MKFQKRIILLIVTAFIFIAAAVWVFSSLAASDTLTEKEAGKLVQEMYGGEIVRIEKSGGIYSVIIQMQSGEYGVSVNAKSGEIMNLVKHETDVKNKLLTEREIEKLVQEKYPGTIRRIDQRLEDGQSFYFVVLTEGTTEITLKIDALSGAITKSEKKKALPQNKAVHKITAKEAVKIALKQVNGKVDEVDLEESGGLSYYMVEIELDNDKEATVQINAITGEVLSVTWDD
ncbi:peptidase propeptide and ypeb domain-containing protein [Bacillus freudenreichii]|nr:peptidase propeptide and ypeb domain-containing protein [Bacillus freudenreichii]